MSTAIKWLSLIGKFAGLATSLSSYASMIPEKYQYIGLIIVGAASILKDSTNRIADLLDNGKLDDSINNPAPVAPEAPKA